MWRVRQVFMEEEVLSWRDAVEKKNETTWRGGWRAARALDS